MSERDAKFYYYILEEPFLPYFFIECMMDVGRDVFLLFCKVYQFSVCVYLYCIVVVGVVVFRLSFKPKHGKIDVYVRISH